MSKIIGSHIPSSPRNLAINGALDFWQEKAGTTTTVNTATATSGYAADMFQYFSGGSTVKNYSVQRSTNIPSLSQSGFQSIYSYQYTQIGAISSFAASDYMEPIRYNMEGLDFAKITGKSITVGFWFFASVAGIYNVSFSNFLFTRAYATTFSVTGANTWQFVSISIPLDPTLGSYSYDNTASFVVTIGGLGGSSFQTSSLNQWYSTATSQFVATTATNWMATAGAIIRMAQFSIIEGPLGFSSTGFARAGDTVQEELAMCQRYYEKSYDIETIPGTAAAQSGMLVVPQATIANGSTVVNLTYRVTKRVGNPAVVYGYQGNTGRISNNSGIDQAAGSGTVNFNGSSGFRVYNNSGGSVTVGEALFHWVGDARL